MTWKCFVASLLIGAVVGHYVPQSQVTVQQQLFLESVEQECTKFYGNLSNSEYFDRTYSSFVECVLKNMDQAIVRDLQTTDPNKMPETAVTFVQNFCLKKDDLSKCFDSLVDAMGPCTDPKVNANKHKVIMTNTVNYVCDNNTQNFKEFIDDGAIPCFIEKHALLMQCTENIHQNGLLPIVRDIAKEKDLETIETKLDEELKKACAEVTSFTSCVQTTLGQCPKPTTAKFILRMNNFVIEGSPCDSNALPLH